MAIKLDRGARARARAEQGGLRWRARSRPWTLRSSRPARKTTASPTR